MESNLKKIRNNTLNTAHILTIQGAVERLNSIIARGRNFGYYGRLYLHALFTGKCDEKRIVHNFLKFVINK